jgi:hypothetical protein
MWRSPFLLITSAALLTACSDNQCGPMGASDTGLVASSDQVLITYGHLSALPGNDCPDPTMPTVISQTLTGTQIEAGTTGGITICIPRPDQLPLGMRSLGLGASMAQVRIVDVTGMSMNCSVSLDSTRIPTGKASGKGVCGDGNDPAGFQLTIDGALSLRRDCAGVIDTVAVTLRGTVAVAHRSQ